MEQSPTASQPFVTKQPSINYNSSKNEVKRLLDTRNQPEFCDVTFIIGHEKKAFAANRMIIASISPVFKAMLYGESQTNATIGIPDISPRGFESVLKFAYCNEPELSPETVISIRQFADKYQAESLSKVCDDYIDAILSPWNFCKLLDKAVQTKITACIDLFKKRMQNDLVHKTYWVVAQGFCKMSVEAMIIFLQWDCLNITEEDLWDNVLKGAEYQVNNALGQHIKPALWLKAVSRHIRFGLMDPVFFIKKVIPLNCLENEELIDIMRYHQCKDEECGSFSIKPRSYCSKTAHNYCCGGD